MIITEKILAKAAELFVKSGIRAITMDDIAREAGVSKRTIYEHFRDKDDLLLACLNFIDASQSLEIEQITKNAANSVEMALSLLKNAMKNLKAVNPLFFDDLRKYHYEVWKKTYVINNEKSIEKIHSLLEKGVNEGLLRADMDIDMVTRLLHAQFKILTDENYFPSGNYSKLSVFEAAMIYMFRGIATNKGIEIIDKYQECII
jgi:AcrR family transcriptional regulator